MQATMKRSRLTIISVGALIGLGLAAGCSTSHRAAIDSPPPPEVVVEDVAAVGMPFVYENWEQITTADGLPDDHVFAVKCFEDKVWIGTENGLACLDKKTGKIESWGEEDGLPWRAVGAIDVHPGTGDVWLGLFGGGLARFSGGRFDHWHQLNSGLVNDVVYGLAIENDNVWVATTAGASRYNTVTGQWTIYTEKNAPMEEIWNYSACYDDGKVYLGVWGSGVLEFDVATERWKDYLDPDGEMEIDLFRDDGIVHVITTGTSHVDGILWVSSYFGMSRYDGRHWRAAVRSSQDYPFCAGAGETIIPQPGDCILGPVSQQLYPRENQVHIPGYPYLVGKVGNRTWGGDWFAQVVARTEHPDPNK